MGDADFGKSIGDGFRAVLGQMPSMDRADIGTFLIKVGTVFASHAGGTSGPIWGTAFLKAGLKAKGKTELTAADLVEMGRAAVQGMMARGSAQIGDKTLLDAIVPALDKIDEFSSNAQDDLKSAFQAASEVATAAIDRRDEQRIHGWPPRCRGKLFRDQGVRRRSRNRRRLGGSGEAG